MNNSEHLHSPAAPPGHDGRLISADVIRACAITLVVVWHVSHHVSEMCGDISLARWWTANIFTSFSLVCVPLFVMLSGMLLLGRRQEEPAGVFLRKRCLRVLAPFIAWSAFYIVWRNVRGESISLPHAALLIYTNDVYVHLWFLYMILGLYLATPILRVYLRQASKSDLWYFMTLWFVTVAILPLIQRLTSYRCGVQMAITVNMVGYYVGGYCLRDVSLNNPTKKKQAAIIVLAAGALTALGTHFLTAKAGGKLDGFLFNFLSANTIIMSGGLFLLLKSLPYESFFLKRPAAHGLVQRLSSASFSVYLIHIVFLEILREGRLGFELSGASLHPAIGIPITSVVVLAACLGVILACRKVPYLRALFP